MLGRPPKPNRGGRPRALVKAPKQPQISIRGTTREALKARAKREGITVKALVERILAEPLDSEVLS